jgi:hypothetical protein
MFPKNFGTIRGPITVDFLSYYLHNSVIFQVERIYKIGYYIEP